MIFEIYTLIGLILGILFLIGACIADDLSEVTPFLIFYIIALSMITLLCSVFCPLQFYAKFSPEAWAMGGEIWIGYALSWGFFLVVFAVAFGIGGLYAILSKRHLWKLQWRIRQLEHQIKEKTERKLLLEKLAGGAA